MNGSINREKHRIDNRNIKINIQNIRTDSRNIRINVRKRGIDSQNIGKDYQKITNEGFSGSNNDIYIEFNG